MADGSVPPPPPLPVLSGAESEDGVSGRGVQPPHSQPTAGSAPGARRPLTSGLAARPSAGSQSFSFPVSFHLTPNAITEVEWFGAVELGLGYAWLSGPPTCPPLPHPPAITRSFSWALGSGSRSRVIGLLHLPRPPSFTEGQSCGRCFDAEVASQRAWTHHLYIFNGLCKKKSTSMCKLDNDKTFGFLWREASDVRNGIFFIHCEIFKSYGTGVYVFCSICMDFWGDWNLPGDF